MQLDSILTNPFLVTFIIIWSIFWKAYALWTSSHKNQITWFLLIMVINTVGLLEILYILYLQKFDLGSPNLLKFINSLPFSKYFRTKKS